MAMLKTVIYSVGNPADFQTYLPLHTSLLLFYKFIVPVQNEHLSFEKKSLIRQVQKNRFACQLN